MRKRWLILILLLVSEVFPQEQIKIPETFDGFPVGYLSSLQVEDASRRLDERELHLLCRLFIKAYIVSVREYNQDYLLETTTPVYRLLKVNLPGLEKREGEGGRAIFLGSITRYLNTLPQFKPDVQQMLREGIASKRSKCL